MEALHSVGAIDRQTMREFDAACLTPVVPMPPERIRALREREHLSQPVFALYLNVSKNLVDRKSTRLNSSHLVISYAVFCLKKKTECSLPVQSGGIAGFQWPGRCR